MKRLLMIMSLIVLLSLFAGPTYAQEPVEGVQIYFGDNVTLKDGESVEGGVIIFGGNFTMQEGSDVEGDVVALGGNVTIDGDVEGDVVALGGNVTVQAHAEVDGDVNSLGGNVSVSPKADVSGVVADGLQVEVQPEGLTLPSVPEIEIPDVKRGVDIEVTERIERTRPGFMTRVGWIIGDGVADIFWSFIIAGLGVLLVLFFPAHVNTVKQTLHRATPVSFVVGFVTLLASIAVIILLGLFFWLLLPICGIIFVALALALGLLGGWTVIGQYVGRRIFARFDVPTPNDISATFLGVAVLTLLAAMPFVDNIPWVGWMFGLISFLLLLVAGSAGLGAVVLSRYGTQSYYPTPRTATASNTPDNTL